MKELTKTIGAIPILHKHRGNTCVLRMASTIVEKYEGASITEEMIEAAARLFSENYGTWGPLAAEKMGPFAKQGA